MTVITAVQKGDEIAIACDTQTTSNDLRYKITSNYRANSTKLLSYGDSIIAHSGSNAIKQVLEALFREDGEPPTLTSRDEIFQWLLAIQPKLKETYLIKASNDGKSQPVESNQVSIALVANAYGIFSLNGYREVNQYLKFWAVGSGQAFALGAMQTLYDRDLSAAQIAEAGALAATEFCPFCAAPVQLKTFQRQTAPAPQTSTAKAGTTKTATAKASTQKATAHKTGTRSTTTKSTKSTATKSTTAKSTAKKTTATQKTTAQKTTPKAKQAATPKTATKKTASPKATAKKPAAKKAVKKTATKKTAARKTATKKTVRKGST